MFKKADVAIQKFSLLKNILLNNGKMSHNYMSSAMIEISSTCNLSCPLCPVANGSRTIERAKTMMTSETFEKIISLTEPFTRSYTLAMWGEPLLNPHFFDYFKRVSHKEVWISTNLNMSEEKAKKLSECTGLNIVCSIDNFDKESYQKGYRRGGDFDVATRTLQILAKGSCVAKPQFLMHDGNKHQKPQMIEFVEGLGIKKEQIIFKTMNMDIKNEAGRFKSGGCHFPYQGLYFNSDGYLLPCCVNIKKDAYMGHIDDFRTPEDLKNGEKIKAFRIQLAKDKTVFPSCKNCNDNMNYKKEILKSFKNIQKSV